MLDNRLLQNHLDHLNQHKNQVQHPNQVQRQPMEKQRGQHLHVQHKLQNQLHSHMVNQKVQPHPQGQPQNQVHHPLKQKCQQHRNQNQAQHQNQNQAQHQNIVNQKALYPQSHVQHNLQKVQHRSGQKLLQGRNRNFEGVSKL
jgi:hypothetical protein